MRAQTAPQKEGLSPFECIYGRPFFLTEIVIDPEALELTKYVTQLSAFQPSLRLKASHGGFLHFKERTFFNSENIFTNNNHMWLLFLIWWHLTILRGEGNGTPLQYSCLENPMDGGAWWAAVHWVAKSRTRLSDFPFTFHFHALEEEMATHSSVLAWRIPGTVGPGGLPSMGSHRVRYDWSDLAAAAATILRWM